LEWRVDHALADAPGMPPAGHTLSTTRITLPEQSNIALERVDIETLRQEHPHWSLVFMTSLIQLSAGALAATLLARQAGTVSLTVLLALTAFTLNVSVLHLGRPAYAWRALTAWRRSWLSREVLLFGLFFVTLAALTAASWLQPLLSSQTWAQSMPALAAMPFLAAISVLAALTCAFGIAGIIASAYIYLVPARPAWNMLHTPVDFVLSSAVLGAAALPPLINASAALASLFRIANPTPALGPTWPIPLLAGLWMANQGIRLVRLRHSRDYEHRAAAGLLTGDGLRDITIAAFALMTFALLAAVSGYALLALPAALLAVLAARYLFFVSVVPLNMALTFVRSVHA
jgi:DMSO reductase anchor subunit